MSLALLMSSWKLSTGLRLSPLLYFAGVQVFLVLLSDSVFRVHWVLIEALTVSMAESGSEPKHSE